MHHWMTSERRILTPPWLWIGLALLWAPGCQEARPGAVTTEGRTAVAASSSGRGSRGHPMRALGAPPLAARATPRVAPFQRVAAAPGWVAPPAAARSYAGSGRAPLVSQVLAVPWGSGPAEAGRLAPREGAPEGPSSLDVDRRGTIYLLDQVNGRVLVARRGRVVDAIPLPSVTYRDVAVLPDGGVAALDRSVLKHVVVLDRARRARFVGLLGPGIPEGGGATALEARADGLWVEWAHQHLVRVADGQGRADPGRPRAWGRFAPRSSRWVRAVRSGPFEVVVLWRRRGSARPSVRVLARISFAAPVRQILGIAPHPSGAVTLAIHSVPASGNAAVGESVVLVHLRADGSEAWRLDLPSSRGGLSPLRFLRLGRDGALYFLHLGRQGVTVWKVTP